MKLENYDSNKNYVGKDFVENDVPYFIYGDSKGSYVKSIFNTSDNDVYSVDSLSLEDTFKNDTKPKWLQDLEKKCSDESLSNIVLVFDNIDQASPEIRNQLISLMNSRSINEKWKLPDNVSVACTGNNFKLFNGNTNDEKIFNNFKHIYDKYKEGNASEYLDEWATKHNIHPSIYDYLKNNKSFKNNKNLIEWETASELLYTTRKAEILRVIFDKKVVDDFEKFISENQIKEVEKSFDDLSKIYYPDILSEKENVRILER